MVVLGSDADHAAEEGGAVVWAPLHQPARVVKGQSEVERSNNTSPGFRGHFAGDGNYELPLEGIVVDISGLRWCDKYKVIVFLVENDEV